MTKSVLWIGVTLAAGLIACNEEGTAIPTPEDGPGVTIVDDDTVILTDFSLALETGIQQLPKPANGARHFLLDELSVPANDGSPIFSSTLISLYFGLPANMGYSQAINVVFGDGFPPYNSNTNGSGSVHFTNHTVFSSEPPDGFGMTEYYAVQNGPATVDTNGMGDFIPTTQLDLSGIYDICIDIHTDVTPLRIVVWQTGEGDGAPDCEAGTNLTAETSFYDSDDDENWTGTDAVASFENYLSVLGSNPNNENHDDINHVTLENLVISSETKIQ